MLYRSLHLSKDNIEKIYNEMITDRTKVFCVKGSKLDHNNHQDLYYLKENDKDIRHMLERFDAKQDGNEINFLLNIEMIKDFFELLVLSGRKDLFIIYEVEDSFFLLDFFVSISFTFPIKDGNCFEGM